MLQSLLLGPWASCRNQASAWLRLVFVLLLAGCALSASAQSDIYEGYAIVGSTYYDMCAATANPDFQGASLGTFSTNAAGQLTLNGGQMKTSKCGSCNVTNATINYRVYQTGSTPGSFTAITLPFLSNDGTANGCGAGNQTWQNNAAAVNLLSGLVVRGSYTVEVYGASDYNGCGTGTNFCSNGGANYKATFDFTSNSLCGTYTVDNTLAASATNYISIGAAIASLNAGSATCATTFNVAAGQTFTEASLAILKGGTSTYRVTFIKSGSGANPKILTTALSSAANPALEIYGASYITIDGIDIGLDPGNATGPRYGYRIRNSSATQGSNNNIIQNATISLNRATATAYGAFISSSTSFNAPIAPSAASGTNQNNLLYNLTITNSANGIGLASNNTSATFNLSDYGNEVSNCTIGLAGTANDIGGAGNTAANFGINCLNEYHVSIHDNTVRNVTGRNTSGISALYCYGTGTDASNVYNNRISNVTGVASSTSNYWRGASLGVEAASAALPATLNFYNNIISGIVGTGSGTSTSRTSEGIYSTGTGSNPALTQVVNVYYNTVLINTGTNNASNACLEVNGITQMTNIVNNILANTTSSTTNKHYCIYSSGTANVGGTGSVVNYNDLYVPNQNGAQGFTGRLNGTDYATLTTWRTAPGTPDLNSVAVDPAFDSAFKPTNTATMDNKGTPLSGFTTDIAAVTRGTGAAGSSTAPDLGAYEFAPIGTDIKPTALTAPASGAGCYGTAEAVTVTVQNSGGSAINFTTNPLTVTVNVTGAVTTTVTTTINTGTLAVGSSQSVAVGTLNMSTAGTYNFAVTATVTGDGNTANDVLSPAPSSVLVTAPVVGTAAASPTSVCFSGAVTLTMTGSAGGVVMWYASTDGYTTSIGSGTPLVIPSVSATTSYKANVVCGSNTTGFSNTVTVTVNAPAVTGTNSPVSACAGSTATLTAAGSSGATLYWYDDLTSPAILATGSSYVTPAVNSTRQFYVGASVLGSDQTAGRTTVPGTTSTNPSLADTGEQFNALTDFVLKTVTVYLGSASPVTTTFYLTNSSNVVLASKVVNLPAGNPPTVTPLVVTLNFAIPAGTGYKLLQTSNATSLLFRESASVYPLTTPGVVSITNGINPAVTTSSYYFFYNWVVATTCNSARTAVQVNVNTTTTWNGSTSTDWFDAANWTSCVPNAFIDATVPTVAGFQPVLNTGTAAVRDLALTGLGTLTMTGTAALDVKGAFTMPSSASLIATGGTISFSDAASQTIPAATYYNLTVSGAATKTLGGDVVVNNDVTLTSGMLDSNGAELQMNSTTGTFVGAGTAHYVVTNGSTGRVRFNNVGSGGRSSVTFPIGTSTYTPATLANTGVLDNFTGTVATGITGLTSHAVNRTWDISEATVGGSNATLTLQWNAADELASFNRNLVAVAHYENSAWNAACYTCFGVANGSGPFSTSRSGITSFSPFAVEDGTKPLPVELTRFVATRQGADAKLSWATASEKNNAGFGVEVSAEGREFRELGFVAGAGSSTAPQSYAFLDTEKGKASTRYYRLRQVDLDGTTNYSPVRTVDFRLASEARLSAAPNPFGGQLTLHVMLPAPAAGALLTVSDATGRLVRQQTLSLPAGATQVELAKLEALPSGIYFLHLTAGGQTQHLKVVKQ